jgi:hypothetical protein
MWLAYELFDLYPLITPATYDSVTVSVFLATLGVMAAYGLIPRRQAGQGKDFFTGKTRSAKVVKPKVKSGFKGLNTDFTIKDVKETFIPSKKKAWLEIIVIGKGLNLHQKVPFKKDLEYKSENKDEKGKAITYKVKTENLNLVKPFFGAKKFVAIFDYDGTPKTVRNAQKNKITSEILNLADRSTTLGKTVKEMFSEHMNWKKILFFVGIGIVAVVIIFIMMGGGIF